MRQNKPLKYDSLSYSESDLARRWQPGQLIEFEGYDEVPSDLKRSTHPEDVLIRAPESITLADCMTENGLLRAVSPFCFEHLDMLFPEVNTDGPSRYVPEGCDAVRSVGYLEGVTVRISKSRWDKNKIRVQVWGSDDHFEGDFPLAGLRELAAIEANELKLNYNYQDIVVRLALAGPWLPRDSEAEQRRCHVMVSHLHKLPGAPLPLSEPPT